MIRPLLLALLTLPAAAHALDAGGPLTAFVVSAMNGAGTPGSSSSSADDDGGDD